jgi:proline dehydrogenase
MQKILYPFAKRFIAGEDIDTSLHAIRSLQTAGYLTSVDILGENVHDANQARSAKDAYLELLAKSQDLPGLNDLSVKLTQLGLEFDPELCQKNLREILQASGPHTVRLDMEGSDRTQSTIDMCLAHHAEYGHLGLALQAYLFRSQEDLETLMDREISVRLCKGAYKEPASIAYQAMDEVRQNFLQLAYPLLKSGNQSAIATHDEYLLKKILSFITSEKIAPNSFFFEMLYGVGRDMQRYLRNRGYRVRVYVPFGKAWLPYTLRRLVERKENIIFVVKNILKEALGLRKLN